MFARKKRAAGDVIDKRICIAARNVNAFLSFAAPLFSKNGDAMCGVFATDADKFRRVFRTNVFESYQTNSRNCSSVVQFRAETRRQNFLYRFRLSAIVDQNSSLYDALQSRDFHFVSKFRCENRAAERH